MSKSAGTILKYIAIVFIIALVLFGFFWKLYLSDIEISRPEKPNNDIENKPFFDRDFSNLKWLFLLLFGVGVGYGIWYLFFNKKKPKDDEEDLIPEPVDSYRAFELVKSHLLRYKFKDIPSRIIRQEKEDFLILEPFNQDCIEVQNEYFDVNRNTGERFHFWFISVLVGKWSGHHLVAVSLSKGEKYIKGGNIRFESGTWIGNFTKKIQNFNMSSPQGEKQRLELLRLDAIRDGDKDTIMETQQMLNSLGSSTTSSAFADEDEEMWKERIRTGQMNSKTKKPKTKKTANNNQNTPEMDLDGGNE